MQFLLVNPSTREQKGATSVALTIPPMGLAYLAAVIEKHGAGVEILDANLYGIDPDGVAAQVKGIPDVIGITVNILTAKMALKYAEELKKAYPKAMIMFGGPYVSVTGCRLLEEHGMLDALIMGEGEATIGEIVERLKQGASFDGVLGVIFRDKGKIIDNGPRPLIADIDSIPMPAYQLLPHLSKYRSRSRVAPVGYVFTSRGCPAACTFCYRNFGTKWRPRSADKVFEEIEFLVKNYGIRQLEFMDDNFASDPARAKRILQMLIDKKLGLKINLQIGVRIHSLDMELLRLMRKAGVFKFGFGIESGDPGILKKIKKGLNLERALRIVGAARSLGMITHGYFIIGFPGDTPETMRRTIDFAKKLNAHYASFSICAPLPGTEMFDDIARNGEFLEDVTGGIDEGLFAMKAFFKYGETTPEEVVKYCKLAWKEFYIRPLKILDVLTTVRSWGELMWLVRVVGDMIRIKR
ncbi:MAG: radical SAM protein [Candidatus Omnitrophica bacterium]|nr:radical SAM protein [Candidatus Omnitrophota bacterium]